MKLGTEKRFTYCIHCARLCGVIAHLRDGYLIKIEGDPESLKNAGTLCPKALAGKCSFSHRSGRRLG